MAENKQKELSQLTSTFNRSARQLFSAAHASIQTLQRMWQEMKYRLDVSLVTNTHTELY
jgi:hypothetical protein